MSSRTDAFVSLSSTLTAFTEFPRLEPAGPKPIWRLSITSSEKTSPTGCWKPSMTSRTVTSANAEELSARRFSAMRCWRCGAGANKAPVFRDVF